MATSAIPTGTAQQSTLSEWAGPYVTDMLGKAKAISETPYQTYQGPMTAGASDLQSKVFQGLGSLTFPSNLGKSFSSPGTYQPPSYGQANPIGVGGPMSPTTGNAPYPTFGPGVNNFDGGMAAPARAIGYTGAPVNDAFEGLEGLLGSSPKSLDTGTVQGWNPGMDAGAPAVLPTQGNTFPPTGGQQPSNIAQSYMNPYLQAVLDPQMAELRRQNDITQMNTNAKMTGAGAFGGGRQAIMNAENNRNLMQEMNKTVGQGYANAYDKAMGQFNTEQGQAKTLADMMSQAGQQQRDIEQQGITADYNEFLAQRDYPMKQTQYLQSMLQGLPISTVSSTQLPQSGIGQLSSTVGGLGSLVDALKKLGIG